VFTDYVCVYVCLFSQVIYYYASANNGRRRHYVVEFSVRLRLSSVHPLTHFVWRDNSLFSGAILVKLATDIHHVSGKSWKGFQGLGSKLRSRSLKLHLLHLSLVSFSTPVLVGVRVQKFVNVMWRRRSFRLLWWKYWL